MISTSSKKILILAFSNLKRDPRVYRQILFLKQDYDIVAAGLGDPDIEGVKSCLLRNEALNMSEKMVRAVRLKIEQFEKVYWASERVQQTINVLKDKKFNLILANDLETLPLALRLAKNSSCKVLLDAHEYEPRHFDDSWPFRFFFQKYWDYICTRYLPQVDAMVTVCEGIAREYEKNFGVSCGVITNAPFYVDQQPGHVNEDHIRMVHHGGLNPSRRIENMIYLTDRLDGRFALDLILVGSDRAYLKKLRKMVSIRSNVRLCDPVPMHEIPRHLNQYDIGLFLLSPKAFSYKMALPNKLFEFIQARLMVAIWPSLEMARVVRKFECGLVSDDFTVDSMAKELNAFNAKDVRRYKELSHRAAATLCAENNRKIFLDTVEGLLERQVVPEAR